MTQEPKHKGTVDSMNRKQIFDAKIYIKNAVNVTATFRIYGIGKIPLALRDLHTSLTFVYVRNSNITSIQRPCAKSSIGKRRKEDDLLHFESRNVTNVSRFPSRAFEYSGEAFITYIGFSFDVSISVFILISAKLIGGIGQASNSI